MRGTAYIFILILLYLVCGARSCNNEENGAENKLLSASKDSILRAFDVDTPSEQSLRAYEATAVQKVYDLSDYLKISCDDSIDITFRKKAAEMAENLFLDERATIQGIAKAFPIEGIVSLKQFTYNCLANKLQLKFRPDSVRIKRSLYKENDSTYLGLMEFTVQESPDRKNKTSTNAKSVIDTRIYLLKRAKPFGREYHSVWSVFLGDMY